MSWPAGFKYLACEVHQVYTAEDSSRRGAWRKEHAMCWQHRAYNEVPIGYEPCLDPLEALAALGHELRLLSQV